MFVRVGRSNQRRRVEFPAGLKLTKRPKMADKTEETQPPLSTMSDVRVEGLNVRS